jgi:hypothetical protein
MSKRIKSGPSTLVLFLAFSPLLFGYGKTWKGAELEWLIKQAGFNLGPFRAKTVFILNDSGYDSNVYRRPDNPVKDYSITAGPAFTIYLPIQNKIVFTIYESPRYVYFFETKQERTWNNSFFGRLQFALNKVFLSVEAGSTVAREIWSTEIDIRPQRKILAAAASVLWQPSKKTSFSLDARESRFQYEDVAYREANLSVTLNHREQSFSAAAFYQITNRMRARIEAEYGRFLFDNSANPRNSESRSIFGGFDFGKGGIVEGRVRLGYKFFSASATKSSYYRGLVGDTAIGVRLGSAFRLRVSYAQDIRFSLWAGYVYFIENTEGAGVSVYLSQNIRFDYDYNIGDSEYPPIIGPGLDLVPSRDDRIQNHRVGIYLRIQKNIGLGIIASAWQRNSTLSLLRSKRLFIGANLTYDF